MPEEKNFIKFISGITESRNFNLFVTLGYCPKKQTARLEWDGLSEEPQPVTPGVRWIKTSLTNGEIERWLADCRYHGMGDYLYVQEWRNREWQKKPDVVLYHLLTEWDGPTAGVTGHWDNLSGGWSRLRELDGRINGFFGYFVMRLGCGLHVNCYPITGRYDQSEFWPWREK